MTLKDALLRLQDRDDWVEVLDYVAKEREDALMDFDIPTLPTIRTSWLN